MTEDTADRRQSDLETQIEQMVARIVERTTRFVENAVRDTSGVEQKVQRAAEKARRQAERAEDRAARINAKVQRRAERGKAPRKKDELRHIGLEVERQALLAVQSALREVEQQLSDIDVEAITRRVEAQLATIDAEGISRQAAEVMREASMQIQQAVERRGYAGGEAGAQPEPVSDEERLAVLQMVQNGTISAEEAETLLDALEGSRSDGDGS